MPTSLLNRLEPSPGAAQGPAPGTLVELLRRRAAGRGDERYLTFLDDGERPAQELTYRELDRRARAVAADLQRRGLGGGRALLLYPPGLEFVSAFFGCLYAGVTAVPLMPPSPSRVARALPRLRAVVEDAAPSAVLTSAAIAQPVRHIADAMAGPAALAVLATDTVPDGAEEGWSGPGESGATEAMLQYTSGSTGTPKGVVLSHRNLLDNSRIIRDLFGFSDRSVGCSWLPVYHDMGLVGMMIQPLDTGCPVVLMSPLSFLQRPMRWLSAISRARATFAVAPNFAYELCARRATPEEIRGLDLSCWTHALVGAEPVRAETLDRFAEVFTPCGFRRTSYFPCYGLAEATLAVSGTARPGGPAVRRLRRAALERGLVDESPAPAAERQPVVSSGRISPEFTVVIADPETGARRGRGEIGEIWVRGGSVAGGYFGRPEESAEIFSGRLADTGEGPFLRTGDLGFIAKGELYVTGRRKDLVILGGRNLYPQDIEATVEACHPALRPGACAAFAIEADAEERLVVAAELERPDDPAPAAAEALVTIRHAVAAAHEAGVYDVVLLRPGAVPKTSSGKIQRHACRAAYLGGGFDVVARLRRGGAP